MSIQFIKPSDFIHLSLAPQFPTSLANYEIHHERYSPQPSFPIQYGSRSTPPPIPNPGDSRRLPPLATSSPPPGERWPQHSFMPSSNYAAQNIRSPTATYPTPNHHFMQYGSNQANAYPYQLPQDHVGLSTHATFFDEMTRSNSPPFRPTGSSHHGHVTAHHPPPQSLTPPPISPTTAEEPTVKKKRKRADANQLKVLNEVYARTAFPSTEERLALAKQLDMTARSVQIW